MPSDSEADSPAISYFVQTESVYVPDEQYFPVIAIYSDNTFIMTVNLFEGMSTINGTYQVNDNIYSFIVLSRDFEGFLGDAVDSFMMLIINDGTLEYIGDQIGTLMNNDIFILSENKPISFIEK